MVALLVGRQEAVWEDEEGEKLKRSSSFRWPRFWLRRRRSPWPPEGTRDRATPQEQPCSSVLLGLPSIRQKPFLIAEESHKVYAL